LDARDYGLSIFLLASDFFKSRKILLFNTFSTVYSGIEKNPAFLQKLFL
jgi:hypothetical protein